MASIEFIKNRVEGKKKEVAKLTKKLERIRKVEAQGWEDPNPYYYSDCDLRCCLKDLEKATADLKKYESQLETETEKGNSRNIPVILEFLEAWKANVRKWYIDMFPKYIEALKVYNEKDGKFCDWYNKERWQMIRDGKTEEVKSIEKERRNLRRNFSSKWSWIQPYLDGYGTNVTFDIKKLNRELDQEANQKYDFIIERTNKIVGQITDASNLSTGNKGDLNGVITGTKGSARVTTIGAGGYNIQCFHFRTLIHSA